MRPSTAEPRTAAAGRAAARGSLATPLPLRVAQVGGEAAEAPRLRARKQSRPVSIRHQPRPAQPGLGVVEGIRGEAAARAPRSADSGALARAAPGPHAPKCLGDASPSLLRLAAPAGASHAATRTTSPLPMPGFGAAWGRRAPAGASAGAGVAWGNCSSPLEVRSSTGARPWQQLARGKCPSVARRPQTGAAAHGSGSASDAAGGSEHCGAPEPSLRPRSACGEAAGAADAVSMSRDVCQAAGGGGQGGGGEGSSAWGVEERTVTVRFRPVHLDRVMRQESPPARLRQLILQGNGLRQLPASLGSLGGLCKLSVTWNELSALPVEVGALVSLRSLDASFNRLIHVPAEVGRLAKLEELVLNDNHLTRLPLSLDRRMSSLGRLSVQYNTLEALPRNLRTITSLTELDVRGNPLLPPSAQQASPHPVHVLDALKQHKVGLAGGGRRSRPMKLCSVLMANLSSLRETFNLSGRQRMPHEVPRRLGSFKLSLPSLITMS